MLYFAFYRVRLPGTIFYNFSFSKPNCRRFSLPQYKPFVIQHDTLYALPILNAPTGILQSRF